MSKAIFVLLGVLLIDQLDAGMMMPLFPALFTDADSPSLLFEPARAEEFGSYFIAILSLVYAVPAFLSQPILGQLADRYGRKPFLTIAFAGSMVSYFLFAIGVTTEQLWLLVVSRALDGFSAGNLLVASAALADLTSEEDRTRFFGYFTAALSLGFVFGPLLGGYLGDPEVASWTGPATAFYAAGVLNLLAVGLFAWLFKESLSEDDRTEEDFRLGQSFENARTAFSDEKRRPLYLVLLLYIAGYTFFITFYSVVLEDDLGMKPTDTGTYFAAMGLALMLVQIFLVSRVEQWFGPAKTLWIALFLAAGTIVIMGVASAPWMAYAAIVPFALGNGLVDPLIASLISKSTDGKSQGRVQGVRGSVDSAGRVFPPLLAGPLAAAGSAVWPVLAGAGVMAAGGALALRLLAKEEGPITDDTDGGGDDGKDTPPREHAVRQLHQNAEAARERV